MELAAYSYNDLALIGRLLVRHDPDAAKALLSSAEQAKLPAPPESDFSRIPHYLDRFCQIRGITPAQIINPDFKTRILDMRREFFAVYISLYVPQLLQTKNVIYITGGSVKHLAAALRIKKNHTGRMMREVATMMRVYEEFRDVVNQIFEQLKPDHGKSEP